MLVFAFEQTAVVAATTKQSPTTNKTFNNIEQTKSTGKISSKNLQYKDYLFDEINMYGEDHEIVEQDNAFENNYQNLGGKSRLSYLSPIERLFNNEYNPNTSKPLMQVGYDFFVAVCI